MLLLLGLLIVTLAPVPSTGTAVTITRLDDAAPTPNCAVTPSDCSLRGAIEQVEADSVVDRTITLPPGRYTLQQGVILLGGGVRLVGSGGATTIIDGLSMDRAFVVAASDTASIEGMTITHGTAGAVGPLPDAGGGAVHVRSGGTLTLTDCIVRDNASTGISNFFGALTLVRTAISGNLGGGIWNQHGVLTASDSTLDGNYSDTDGGGLYSVGTATLTGCTLSNNVSGGAGGGLVNASSGAIGGSLFGTVTLTNCTVSGNVAGVRRGFAGLSRAGGGIFALPGLVTLNNVTVTDNVAHSGAGVAATAVAANLAVQNSIIAGNRDEGGAGSDCEGSVRSLGYNLLGSTPGCTVADGTLDLTGRDPLLGPLADNGGPTRTHALLPGSPAIDAANPSVPGSDAAACPAADQRGVLRPQPAGGRCDIGAFELAPPPTTERCGDCLDNDGNGLTDFEEPGCCATGATLRLRASRVIRGRRSGRLGLRASLLPPVVAPSATEDLFIQLRVAGHTDFLCARIPAANLVRRGGAHVFDDPEHAVTTARGVEAVELKEKKGRLGLKVRGTRLALPVPSSPGRLQVTVGLRSPLAAEAGNRCASVMAPFKRRGKGVLRYP